LLQFCRFLTALAVLTSLFFSHGSFIAFAAQGSPVEEFSRALDRLLQDVEALAAELAEGVAGPQTQQALFLHAENFQACRLLLADHLLTREKRLEGGNLQAKTRHHALKAVFSERFRTLDPLLEKVLSQQALTWSELDALSAQLERLVTPEPGSLHGTVPYRQLQLQTVGPRFTPSVSPAYKSTSTHYIPADLQTIPDAPLSQAIYQQALKIAEASAKQNWDPVDLYEWVKNNIRTEWYWGSMKGAEETLRQGSGNDADQAALLIALLRAAGYPSRYVRGVVEFFPDLDMARRLTGIDDAARIGEFLRKAGIPHQAVMSGAEIVNYQLEHIWVETLIPYANYRGALADTQGKLWLPLDTSFKVADFNETGELDLSSQAEQPLASLRDDYLGSSEDLMPLEFVRTQVESLLAAGAPDVLYNSALHRRDHQPETLHILSAVPQFTELAVTGEYQQLPEELIHKVRFTASDAGPESELVFDLTLPVRDLSNQKVQISYQAESLADQETINSWGGLDNTPSYLVRLRPVLVVKGVRQVVGQKGFAVGDQFDLTVTMQSPSTSVTTENRVIAGYPQLLGIVAQDVVLPQAVAENAVADELLYQAALAYIEAWNRDETQLAELHNLVLARPLPTLVSLGGMMKVTELLGQPQSVSWQGLFLDADLRSVEAVVRNAGDDSRLLTFMQLSALQGSALEHRVLEEHFQVESISTARLLRLARNANLTLLTITAENLEAVLSELNLSPIVADDIRTAVAEGLVVQIPDQPVTVRDWTGTGYLKEVVATGNAGYMLSGAIGGGNTVLGKKFWPRDMADKMARPYRGEPNRDVTAAQSVTAITPWQVRQAVAGEELTAPLMVRVADEKGRPVAGAPVLFTVNKGGGQLLDDRAEPAATVSALTLTTGDDGIARARFIPGESVFNHPIVISRPGDTEANIAGENLISVQLATGSFATLDDPVIVLGFAGQPDPQKLQLIGAGRIGDVLSYTGDSGVILYDRFGNPVANHAVTFEMQDAVANANSDCLNTSPSSASAGAEIIEVGEACLNQLPVRGECGRAASSLTMRSRSDGSAMVGVMLGGLADAVYPLVATLETTATPASQFVLNQHAAGNGACGAAPQPVDKLILTYPRLQDAEGRNVDARPVGSLARINVKSYLLYEDATEQADAESLSCSPAPDLTCKQMLGNGEFSIAAPDQVLGNHVPLKRVTTLAESTAMPYLYGLDISLTAGLNQIPLSATASYERAVFINQCSGCAEKDQLQQKNVGPIEATAEIWGVALQTPDTLVARVDDTGRLLSDTAFAYTIEPAGYVAGMAQVLIYADGELWESILAATSGTAEVIIPAGYTFLPNKTYHIQLLLGNPGDANRISSQKVPVLPIVSKVDLRIDGLPELIEDQVGAFVLLNNDFDESDRDASVTLSDIETTTMIPEDDELKRAWLHIDDADMLNGTWQLQADNPSELRIYYEHGGQRFLINPGDPPQLITETPLTLPLYLEGVAESPDIHANRLTLTYISSQGIEISDSLPLTVLYFDLAVDGNRDRQIEFDEREDESALFWVNNDHDVETFSFGDLVKVEDDEESGDDSLDNKIPCRRDLEDFSRMQVDLGATVKSGQMSFSAEIVAHNKSVQPRVNIFPAVSLTDDYLGLENDPAMSLSQVAAKMLAAVGEEQVAFPLDAAGSVETFGYLYEGRSHGQGRFVLKARYNGVPVLQRTVDLSLYDISYFYDHYLVEGGGNAELTVNPKVNPVGVDEQSSREALYQGFSDEYVMFVHGWNVKPWEKKRWAETVFKRLWWQGYKGRVGLFDWPCQTLPSLDVLVNYDRSEYLAWNSAKALTAVLEALHREDALNISLLAHSQGNVVVGESLRLANANTVKTYVASQAALSASLYSGEYPTVSMLPALALDRFDTPAVMSLYPGRAPLQNYFVEVPGKIETLINYFNRKDYALVEAGPLTPGWEYNNQTRPDNSIGYGYDGDTEDYSKNVGNSGFYRDTLTTPRRDLTFPDNDHEIFSFIAESRTKALGAVLPFEAFLNATVSVDAVGSRDLEATSGYDNKRYSHSRQFRSNIVNEHNYWRNFTVDCGLSNSK